MDSNKESGKYKINDIAASYQSAIVDCLVSKIKLASQITGVDRISIAGGVAKQIFKKIN